MSLLRRGVALCALACALALCLGLAPSTARADEPAWTYNADAKTLTSNDDESGRVTLRNVYADGARNLTIGSGYYYQAYDGESFGDGSSGALDLTGTVTGGDDSAYTIAAIGQYAFSGCDALTSVDIPGSVETIDDRAFSGCTSLTSVGIPDSVGSIGTIAFYECTSLESVIIGSGVKSIGSSAFKGCSSLESVTIPGSVGSIGSDVFLDCSSLEKIDVDGGNTAFTSEDGVLYAKDKTKLLVFPGGRGGDFTVPETVTNIERAAFYKCAGLTSVTIPGSVGSVGYHAFYGCTSLETVTFLAEEPPTLGVQVFEGCNSLTRIDVPAGSEGSYGSALGAQTSFHGLTVENGSGSGLYAEGATVTVEAGEEPGEGRHIKWTLPGEGDGEAVTKYGKSVTFEMPARDAGATYELEAHSFGGWTDAGVGTHSCECACGEAEVQAHTFSGGYCAACGAEDPGYVPPAPAPTYAAEVAEAEHGTASASPSRARAGRRVTVTAAPDEGFEVRSVVVTDSSGAAVEVAGNADGTWSFSMPAGGATVSVEFGCDGGALCPSAGLSDVDPSQWYHDAVDLAVSSGLMTGYADGSGLFGPGDELTREQAAAVLWRALGQGANAPSCGMADVDPGAWYAGAVGWAASSGLMTGYDDGSGLFGVGDALTREQLATVLWRAAGSPDAGAFDGSAFSDGGEASEWASPALAWAVQTGVLSGSDDGAGGTALRPTAAVARAEMAAMVTRWLAAE